MPVIYMTQTGESVEAATLADKAVILSERRPYSLYFAALTYLASGHVDTCLDLLRETISRDESYRQLVATDPDLKNISALEQL